MRIKQMDERKRRKRNDSYVDDVLRDGEVLHVPVHLADSRNIPWPRSRFTPANDAAPMFHFFAKGYCLDQISDPVTQGGWPTQVEGVYPMYNNAVGDPCKCRNGKPGTLRPHPTMASALICVENLADAAYWYAKDAASTEWMRHGPPSRSCCSGCASHDQQGTVGYVGPPPVQWPQGQNAGDECMDDRKRPGRLVRQADGSFRCVANNGRDQAPTNIGPPTARTGFEWAEGGDCACTGGEPGRYVRQGDMLICQPRQDLDHRGVDAQAIRDRAWLESVRAAENAWRSW
jgi:hypothetical protein